MGQRYKCRDCPEAIGFDLCGACRDSGITGVGRFNQAHTVEHQLVQVGGGRAGGGVAGLRGGRSVCLDVPGQGAWCVGADKALWVRCCIGCEAVQGAWLLWLLWLQRPVWGGWRCVSLSCQAFTTAATQCGLLLLS